MSTCSQLAEVGEVTYKGFALLLVAVIREYRRIIRLVACNYTPTALMTETLVLTKEMKEVMLASPMSV